MKFKLIMTLLVLAFVSLIPSFALADLGNTDTLIILTSRPEAGADDSTFTVEAWVYNDQEGVAPQFGFSWDSEALTLDSAKPSAESMSTFDVHVLFDGSNQAQSNTNNRAMFSGISFSGKWFPINANRHLLVTYYFSLASWDASSEIYVDTNRWDDGSNMKFVTPAGENIPVYAYGDAAIWIRDPSGINDNNLPAVYSLSQNYPNPFNPETTIEFSLEQAGDYTFTIFNVIGQVVYEAKETGTLGLNQIPFDGSNYASGVYFYKLEAGNFTETKKMMLIK